MARKLSTTLLLSLLMWSATGPDRLRAAAAARIDLISPSAARPGDAVTLTGNGFGGRNVRVSVGGVAARVVGSTGNSVTFLVPAGAAIGATAVAATNSGGQSGAIAFRVLLGFELDTSASRQTSIGPEGGTLAVESGGTTYTLAIPPAALDQVTPITLTPITSIVNLPFSNGVAAGAHFAPSGLQLHRTATLTIDRPSGGFPPDLLGFLVDDQGLVLEVLGVAHGTTQIVLPVDHFTAGGAGAPTLADFERQVIPLLNALPSTLPPSQVASLISLLVAWLDQFGFSVCTQTNLCTRIFSLAVDSLTLHQTQACAQAATFIDQGEPFLAHTTLRYIVRVAARLFEVATLATQAGVPGFDQPFDTACVGGRLKDIVDLAKTQALANPRGSLLLLIGDISQDAQFLEDLTLSTYALTELKAAMDTIAERADQQACPQDHVSGETLLDVILNHFPDHVLDALEPGYADQLHDIYAGCRIQIVPAAATVGFDEQLTFSAATNGLSPAGVTWSIDGPGLATTIDSQSGLFTAARNAGTVIIKATSLADSSRFKRARVDVIPRVQITITPATTALGPGATAEFTAQVEGADPLVRWTATGGSITPGPSATATYTAGSNPGEFSVTATSVDDPTKSQTVTVTVTGGPGRTVTAVGQQASIQSNATGECYILYNAFNRPLSSCPGGTIATSTPFTEYHVQQHTIALFQEATEEHGAINTEAVAVLDVSIDEEDDAVSIRTSGSTMAGIYDYEASPPSGASAVASFIIQIEIKQRPANYRLDATFFGDGYVHWTDIGNSQIEFQFASHNVKIGPAIPEGSPTFVSLNNKTGTLQPGIYTLTVSAASASVFGRSVGMHTSWGFRLDIESQ